MHEIRHNMSDFIGPHILRPYRIGSLFSLIQVKKDNQVEMQLVFSLDALQDVVKFTTSCFIYFRMILGV